jgi:hypothetical protein
VTICIEKRVFSQYNISVRRLILPFAS